MKPRWQRSAVVNIGLLILGFSLLGVSVASNRSELHRCLSGQVVWQSVSFAFLLYSCGMMLAFLRWYFFVRMLGVPLKLSDSLRLSFVGGLFNLIIPGAVGGDFVKAAFLSQMDVPKVRVYSSMVIDRLIGLLGLFLLASMAGISGWQKSPADVHRLTVFALIITTGLIMFLSLLFRGVLTRNSDRMPELRAMSLAYGKQVPALIFWLAVSVLVHICNTSAFYLMSMGIMPDLKTGILEHFQIVPLVLFSTAVPLPLGAIGLSENISDVLFRSVGHPSGAIGMLGFRMLQFGFAGIAAMVYVANLKSIKKLTEYNEASNQQSSSTVVSIAE
ncbi:MAG: hypothetical protein RJA81_1227 [Planctomycetota bacterium]|jgi:uncharacterized membrane protein YbhN (UPF0104 family)